MNKKIINKYIKRGYASRWTWMGLLLLPLLLFSSCVDESVTSGSTTSSDSTQVHLTFNLQQPTSLTRSLSSTGTSESQVDNINVLIFDGNGKLIGSTYQTYGTSQTSSFSVTVPTRVASGCTIYAVANLPSDSLKNVATVSDFNKKFILMSSAATLGNGSNMVMFGKMSPMTISSIPSSNNFTGFTLTRLGSKVTFNITPATGITITGYQLCHVPMSSYLTNATDSTYFNAKRTYGNFDAVSGLGSITKVSPCYYMYENLVGRKSGATSFFSRSKANAPTDASYLMIYAARADSGWTATYRIYLGGTGMSDYTNYNVPRNYSYTYNINIDGADEADVRVRCLPNIGDYYYSDGTFGTSKIPSGATVIGVVFSTRMGIEEQNAGYTHGYVMALKDANSGGTCTWGPNTNTPLPDKVTQTAFYNDLSSGYVGTYTNSIFTGGMANSTYPAFNVAKNYALAYPISSTGWYLPSMGQWWDVIANLGGVDMSTYQNSLLNASWNVGDNTTSNKINGYFTAVGGTALNVSDLYWAALECSTNYAGYVQISSSNVFMGAYNKSDPHPVRAILAF
jgi:hypothetical protein